jgi:predicted dehydrogenase
MYNAFCIVLGMDMEPLRFGLIGGAGNAFIGDVHRHGAQMDDLAILSAGCFSRDPEKNRDAARKWHVDESRVYADYIEMAEKESARQDGIDFVIIATPNNTHYPIAKYFLEHGIHVSCDKPVAVSVAEAEELQQIANQCSLHFGVSYTYVNYPMVHQMRAMIEGGEIGRVLTVMAEYPQDWVINSIDRGEPMQDAWRFNPAVGGKSAATGDIGTHVECLIHMGTGLSVERVLANLTRIPADMPLETNTQLLATLTGGVPGMLWASQVAIGYECSISLRVFGDKGALEWCHDNPSRLKYTRVNGPETYLTCARSFLEEGPRAMSRLPYGHPEGFFEAFGNYYRAFCREVLRAKKLTDAPALVHPTIEDGVRGLRFIEACLKSQEQGNIWISVQ